MQVAFGPQTSPPPQNWGRNEGRDDSNRARSTDGRGFNRCADAGNFVINGNHVFNRRGKALGTIYNGIIYDSNNRPIGFIGPNGIIMDQARAISEEQNRNRQRMNARNFIMNDARNQAQQEGVDQADRAYDSIIAQSERDIAARNKQLALEKQRRDHDTWIRHQQELRAAQQSGSSWGQFWAKTKFYTARLFNRSTDTYQGISSSMQADEQRKLAQQRGFSAIDRAMSRMNQREEQIKSQYGLVLNDWGNYADTVAKYYHSTNYCLRGFATTASFMGYNFRMNRANQVINILRDNPRINQNFVKLDLTFQNLLRPPRGAIMLFSESFAEANHGDGHCIVVTGYDSAGFPIEASDHERQLLAVKPNRGDSWQNIRDFINPDGTLNVEKLAANSTHFKKLLLPNGQLDPSKVMILIPRTGHIGDPTLQNRFRMMHEVVDMRNRSKFLSPQERKKLRDEEMILAHELGEHIENGYNANRAYQY